MVSDNDAQCHQMQLRKEKREFSVGVFDHDFVLSRWEEIERILYRVFVDSNFNEEFTRTRPAEHTWNVINEPYQEGLKHVIALDLHDEILGAFFAIPAYKPPSKTACDLGWMFTIELNLRFRHEVMNAIINKVHDVTKAAGFERIITEMGTATGAKFLSKKHGYIHTPLGRQTNRWTKELY